MRACAVKAMNVHQLTMSSSSGLMSSCIAALTSCISSVHFSYSSGGLLSGCTWLGM